MDRCQGRLALAADARCYWPVRKDLTLEGDVKATPQRWVGLSFVFPCVLCALLLLNTADHGPPSKLARFCGA